MKKITILFISLVFGSFIFAQQDSTKKTKPLSHFPSNFDKDPGFYSVASQEFEGDVAANEENGGYGTDEDLIDYFGEFDNDTDEDHKKAEMYTEGDGFTDPFAETDEIAIRDRSHTWFAEDKNIVIARSHYKNGRLNGRYRKWTDDGKQLITDMAYKKGRTQGKATLFHANGQKKSETYYNRGKLNGSYVRYDESGKKLRQGFFIKGKREGEQITFHENGQIKTVTNYKRGKKNGVYIEYDKNGEELERINYIKGLKEGASDGVRYKKTKRGKIYRFRINETDNDIKIEKERIK